MRLLNARTRKLEEFGDNVPGYYILSHRWGDNEVSYKDFTKQRVTQGQGYEKITNFCDFALRQARHHGKHDRPCYVWIDTCTIDKRSSAELSEAINSMYKYYAEAEVCYVYLTDVSMPDQYEGDDTLFNDTSSEFRASKWFTRGWTLQELLAPSSVVFTDRSWQIIGHKCQNNGGFCCSKASNSPDLNDLINSSTGIGRKYLTDRQKIRTASIARRMSWAAKSQTSRIEDQAYCLLGLFDINMPLIYGEGQGALHRLQQEIIKQSTDMSIFAWWYVRQPARRRVSGLCASGLFASSVSLFVHSGDIITRHRLPNGSPYALRNAGLHLQTSIRPLRILQYIGPSSTWVIELNCGIMVPTDAVSDSGKAMQYVPIRIGLKTLSKDTAGSNDVLLFERILYADKRFDLGEILDEPKVVSLFVMPPTQPRLIDRENLEYFTDTVRRRRIKELKKEKQDRYHMFARQARKREQAS